MSASDDQRARPIPVAPPSVPPPAREDAVYVVDTRGKRPRRAAAAPPPGAAAAPPPRPGPPAAAPPADPAAYDALGRPLPASATPPPVAPAPHRRAAPAKPGPRNPAGPRRRLRLILGVLAAWLAFVIATPLVAWAGVSRVETDPGAGRPADGSGSTYLLVGSDSREGLSDEDRARLGTGNSEGRRTDSIILVHVPSGDGLPALISVPRDSYLPIPGVGRDKVNAAFAVGGPQLLVETLEGATGLRIDGYVEIGFGGFADVVDSLGGVDICVPRDISDDKAHIELTKGCQTLDGPTALGYVRARYSDPRGDLGRAERQRQFLGAVMKRAATPSTVLLPHRWWGFNQAAAGSVLVGEDTSALDAARILSTMRKVSSEQALSLVVPVSSTNASTNAGSAVLWDEDRAADLFGALNAGTPLDAPPPGTDGEPSGR